jgi:hypothetical protein
MNEFEPEDIKVSEADIRKYQELCKKYFSETLSNKEARVKLNALIRQLEIAYQPITREQLLKLLDERSEGLK